MSSPPPVVESTPDPIDTIDATLRDLRAELERLEKKRLGILAERSLIRKVPPEILGRILTIGAEEDPLVPITATEVSKHWKEVALNTHAAWASINIDFSEGRLFKWTSLFLGRSGSCPIYVRLNIPYASEEQIIPVMLGLEPHLTRCRSLQIITNSGSNLMVAYQQCLTSMPELRDLSLTIEWDTPSPIAFPEGSTENLRSIYLERIPADWKNRTFPQLRTLILKQERHDSIFIPVNDLIAVLSFSPLLEELTIQWHSLSFEGNVENCPSLFEDEPPITLLPSLRKLDLSCATFSTATFLLSTTSAPNLRHLAIRSPGSEDVYFPRLSGASALSLSSLETLEVENWVMTGIALAGFVRLLHQLPLLKRLDLLQMNQGSHLFDLMASPLPTGAWICPKLQIVSAKGCDYSGQEILRFVRARYLKPDKVARIQSLTVSECYSFESERLVELRAGVETVKYEP